MSISWVASAVLASGRTLRSHTDLPSSLRFRGVQGDLRDEDRVPVAPKPLAGAGLALKSASATGEASAIFGALVAAGRGISGITLDELARPAFGLLFHGRQEPWRKAAPSGINSGVVRRISARSHPRRTCDKVVDARGHDVPLTFATMDLSRGGGRGGRDGEVVGMNALTLPGLRESCRAFCDNTFQPSTSRLRPCQVIRPLRRLGRSPVCISCHNAKLRFGLRR